MDVLNGIDVPMCIQDVYGIPDEGYTIAQGIVY